MAKPVPVILAAGRGERLGTSYPKPMVSVDGHRPVIASIVHKLLNCGYAPGEIGVVVGHNPVPLVEYLGAGFLYAAQTELGHPARGIMDWLTKHTMGPTGLLVIHGDDAEWPSSTDIVSILTTYDKTGDPVLGLTGDRDNEAHSQFFSVDISGKVLEHEKAEHRRGYNTGVFCVNSALISDHYARQSESTPKGEVGIGTLVRKHVENTGAANAVFFDGPWKSINTLEGLFKARQICRNI